MFEEAIGEGGEIFEFALVGDGPGGDFDLLQKGLKALDKNGKPAEGGVELIEGSVAGNGSSYSGQIKINQGVKRVELGASWRSNGELSGEEEVTLSLTRSEGLSGEVTTKSGTATLSDNGLDDCPPADVSINRSFKLEAECASLVANEVSASASAAALKADDCGCSPTMLMAAPEASLGLEGSAGSDDIDGGAADDEIDGGSGDDDLSGGAGDDEIDGGAGVDVISGGIGQDDLDGGAGNDVLNGGVGNDLIDGGDGDDLLSGGSGSDDFQISAGNDIIKDFNPLDFDKIVLPPAPLLPPGQMPSFTQEGADVFIRYQNWKTVVQNALVKDVVIAAKADQARFSFKVSELDLPELPGSLGSETFSYQFASNKQDVDFEIEEAYLSNSAGGRIELERDSSVGDFEVPYGWEEFNINVLVSKPDGAFDGDEALTLQLKNDVQASRATSDLADLDPSCSIEPPPPPQVERPELLLVGGGASCEIDGEINGRDALFQYTITLKPGDSSSTFNYDFSATGLQADGYTLDVTYSTPSGQVSSADLDAGNKAGTLTVGEGVSTVNVEVRATAASQLSNSETLTFTVEEKSHTAALGDENCDVEGPDGQLYLLMDRSTSMLGSDPSTVEASLPNRLEAQNRTAFASFEQAAQKAGYAFRRKGESEIQQFDQSSLDAITNNGSRNLAEALKDYELIDNPGDGKIAGDLTVELIKFGYVVEHEAVTFTSDDPITGLSIAEAILLTTTPDQIYGNSIDGNPLWVERGLPQPDARDFFQGDGALASNLYAGTELFGALIGLEHRLAEQQASGQGTADDFTFVTLTTDGRPERREWWGNREGNGTGVNVPLPQVLGGDAITSAGLLYDNDGNAVLVPFNDGSQRWTSLQDQLNARLNDLGATLANPSEQLKVLAVGMGDGSDANFPAIYSDLFGNRTFDANASWSYDWAGSFRLPNFTG